MGRRGVALSQSALLATDFITSPFLALPTVRFRGKLRKGRSGHRSRAAKCPPLCRVSDAGMTRLSTRCGGRRPKSAKARNRGKWGTGGATEMKCGFFEFKTHDELFPLWEKYGDPEVATWDMGRDSKPRAVAD